MDNNTLLSILGGAGIVGAIYYYINRPVKKEEPVKATEPARANGLQLQAYERLALLVDRIAIPNLIGRTSADGLNARDMQFILTKNIRDEFEYNITQQIYVSSEIWNAVKGLKEKNLLLINQVAGSLPSGATGMDLNRALLQYLVTNKQAELPEIVSQALSFEAKKLL